MDLYRVLGASIAESVNAVGAAFRGLGQFPAPKASARAEEDWAQQFSLASLIDRRGRRTVEALYRASTVRL